MIFRIMGFRVFVLLGFLSFIQTAAVFSADPIQYPATRREVIVEEQFGVNVADPFRWLEDDNATEVKQWVDAEGRLASQFLDSLPQKSRFVERLTKIWDFDSYGTPYKVGGRYFFEKKIGLKNQPLLYVASSLDREPEVFLDPNEWSKDGTIALSSWNPSNDGSKMAILISRSGSDWQEAQVWDIATKKQLSDELKWIKFSGITWDKKGEGFYYARFAEPKTDTDRDDLLNQKLYYHKLGTDQKIDQLIFERPENPQWMFGAEISRDDKYLIVSISGGTGRENQLWIKDLEKPDSVFVPLVDNFESQVSYVSNEGADFVLFTNKNAPRSKVVRVNLNTPTEWKDFISESEDSIDEGIVTLPDGYAISYLHNASSLVKIFDFNGNYVKNLELPGIGTFSGLGAISRDETERFFSFSSFTTAKQVFHYDAKTGAIKLWKKAEVAFDSSEFVTEQIFAPSKDGTLIPVFVVHKKDIKLDGSHPTILYGYGGFNISILPGFDVKKIAWLQEGGIYAIANLRGGGEFGDAWHNGGRRANKQNVFDDFIGAAEKLIADGYTSKKKLAINGGSNGGLLVAAALVQRPDLFAAAVPEVGVLDMLRFHKFTIGAHWRDDYGDPDIENDFKVLFGYSPYHNIKLAAYPATMIMTGDHDDRVVPGHSFKFAAMLQAAQLGSAPILLRVQKNGGHGAGTPTSVLINSAADRCAFILAAMGVE